MADGKNFLDKASEYLGRGKKEDGYAEAMTIGKNKEVVDTSSTNISMDNGQLYANVKITLMNLFENALTPYQIKNPYFANSAIKNGKEKNINDAAKTIADIYFNYFTGLEKDFYSIKFSSQADEKIIVCQNPNENGNITIGQKDYEIIDHLELSTNIDKESLEQLKILFFFLGNIYKAMGKVSQYSNKPVIGIEGLNDLILAATNSENPIISKQNTIEAITAQVKSIIQSDIAVIDSKTIISLFSMDTKQLKELKEFIDEEIARILMIPLTKLTGRPQAGLNTTGGAVYDDKNYEDTLELIRSKFIEPTLYFFKIPFESNFPIEGKTFLDAMNGLDRMDANVGISIENKNKLRENILRPFLRGVKYDG